MVGSLITVCVYGTSPTPQDQYRFVYASLARKLVSLIEEEERFNSNFTDRSELNDLIEL